MLFVVLVRLSPEWIIPENRRKLRQYGMPVSTFEYVSVIASDELKDFDVEHRMESLEEPFVRQWCEETRRRSNEFRCIGKEWFRHRV